MQVRRVLLIFSLYLIATPLDSIEYKGKGVTHNPVDDNYEESNFSTK